MSNNRFEQNYKCKLIGEIGQSKLSKSKVLIVGAGGTGCPVFTYLLFTGVGDIYITDYDVVEESNLNRQFLYNYADIGNKKSLALFCKFDLLSIKDKQKSYSYGMKFKEFIKENKKKFDLIIDCTDNYKTKIEIQDYSKKNKIPCIICGVHGYQINMFCWHPKYSKNTYNELFNCKDEISEKSKGTFPTSVGILGTLVASEAIKILIGLQEKVSYNTLFYYNILENNLFKRELE